MQLKCAELLISQGCKVDDLTTGDHPSSVLFFACQSKSYGLAQSIMSKVTVISGVDESGNNTLHQLADDYLYYPEATKVLKLMATKFGGQAKKMAVEEDDEGFRPIHKFYKFCNDEFGNYQFLNWLG